jgi:DNA mismatch repair ATPase MutS
MYNVMFSWYLPAMLGAAAMAGRKPVKIADKRWARPMQKFVRSDERVGNLFACIATLDELNSWDKVSREWPTHALPNVTESETHAAHFENLVNPVQVLQIPGYVPNTVSINGERFIFLSGPNSGGKTSLGKAIFAAQVFSQLGVYGPFSSGSIVPADSIGYQIGINDTQGDAEGGFGTQMKRSKYLYERSTRKSLLVLDDLMDGTTQEEKDALSRAVLCGLHHKGTSVIYINHHPEMADWFAEKGAGDFFQMGFDGEKPTHKIIGGISRTSHANLVAERVGLSPEQIQENLVSSGYLSPGQSLFDISRRG